MTPASTAACAPSKVKLQTPDTSAAFAEVPGTAANFESMIALARKSGFAFGRNPDDWKLVRVEKHIDIAPRDIPCASWRLAAANAALGAAASRAV